ncbi:MAG: hypothetical protein AABW73_04145 [Nanoarchaeota archaeon]
MFWENWNYRKRGLLVGIFLWILILLVKLYFSYFYSLFSEGSIIVGILSLLFCYISGWAIDVAKNDSSSTKKGLFYGLILSTFALSFMFFEGYFNLFGIGQQTLLGHMVDNFVGNSGHLWMSIPIIIFTLIGFIIDKTKKETKKSKEILKSIISALILLVIIFGLYGVGSYFYSDNPSKCEYFSDKDNCYSSVALNLVNQGKLEISLCEKIQYDSLKFKCYIWLAGQNKDLQVCDNIPYYPTKDQCISNLALLQNDPSICDKTQKEFKEECLKWVSQGSSSY